MKKQTPILAAVALLAILLPAAALEALPNSCLSGDLDCTTDCRVENTDDQQDLKECCDDCNDEPPPLERLPDQRDAPACEEPREE